MGWEFGFYHSTDHGLRTTAWRSPQDLPKNDDIVIISMVGTGIANYGVRKIGTGYYKDGKWHIIAGKSAAVEAWQEAPEVINPNGKDRVEKV